MKYYKLPYKHIDVFGAKYKIIQQPVVVLNGSRVCGYCDNEKREIYIEYGDKDSTLKTYFHEVGHAVDFRTSMYQTSIDNDHMEIMRDTFSVWLIENYDLKRKKK